MIKMYEGFIQNSKKLRKNAEKYISDFFKKYDIGAFIFMYESESFDLEGLFSTDDNNINIEYYDNDKGSSFSKTIDIIDETILYHVCDNMSQLNNETILECLVISGQVDGVSQIIKLNKDIEIQDWHITQLYEINPDSDYSKLQDILFNKDPERFIKLFVDQKIDISDEIREKYKEYEYVFNMNDIGLM